MRTVLGDDSPVASNTIPTADEELWSRAGENGKLEERTIFEMAEL